MGKEANCSHKGDMDIAWLTMLSCLQKQCRTRKQRHATAAIELDWSDSGTWTGVGAAVLGIAIGIGAPIFYSQRDDLDEARLEELREMNRQHYKETGRYLTDVSYSLCACFHGLQADGHSQRHGKHGGPRQAGYL